MNRILSAIVVAAFLTGCASKQSKTQVSTEETPASTAPTMRYLAWLEGDLQNDYQPSRKIAEAKLQRWEGNVPEVTDREKYLEYLSTLDATGKSSEAEGKIKLFLSKNPDEKRGVFLLAVHYLRRQKKELAQYFFNQLDKDPNFVWKSLLLNNLGMLSLQEKNRVAAIGYFEKATTAVPPTPAPFVNLGALYLQSRSYVEAEKLFRRALELDSDFEDAALGLGVALEGQGKFEDAHKTYADAIDGNSDALSVLYNDSIILGNRLKRRDEAAQQMLRYIQRGGKETAKAHEIIQSWR